MAEEATPEVVLELLPVTLVRAPRGRRAVSHRARYDTLEEATISPWPQVPVGIWLGGTVPAAAGRAERLGDGGLTGRTRRARISSGSSTGTGRRASTLARS